MPAHRIHGMWHLPEYKAWQRIKTRCYNSNIPQFKYWGGRGITVCDRWLQSFLNFYEDMGPRPDCCTLDRIDNDGNYEPGNCRWATLSQQNMNRRRPVKGPKANGRCNTSKYKGVCRRQDFHLRPWKARAVINGKERHLGCFATEEEAAAAYEKAIASP